jgi:hypothetical protein
MKGITANKEATAERVRLHRERRRRGLRCLMIEIRDREIDALVRHGLLDSEKHVDLGATPALVMCKNAWSLQKCRCSGQERSRVAIDFRRQ